jgi:hypothetical protein
LLLSPVLVATSRILKLKWLSNAVKNSAGYKIIIRTPTPSPYVLMIK